MRFARTDGGQICALTLRRILECDVTIGLPWRCGASHNVEWQERTDCFLFAQVISGRARREKGRGGYNGGVGPPINWGVRLPGASQGLEQIEIAVPRAAAASPRRTPLPLGSVGSAGLRLRKNARWPPVAGASPHHPPAVARSTRQSLERGLLGVRQDLILHHCQRIALCRRQIADRRRSQAGNLHGGEIAEGQGVQRGRRQGVELRRRQALGLRQRERGQLGGCQIVQGGDREVADLPRRRGAERGRAQAL